jgi:ABC-type amino acid transport substrate-binding protein
MKNIFVKNGRIVRFVGITLLVIAVVIGLIRLLQSPAKTEAYNRPLRIGMMSGWPPFMSIDEQGNYVGFDVDVARLIGKQLGRDVEILDGGSLSTLFLSLETNKIDLIFSGLDITQERQKRMNMVPYTGEETSYLYAIFNEQVPQGITNFADLIKLMDTVTVCVEANSASEELLKFYPQITKKQLMSMADMVLDVQTGKSTALLAEPQVGRRFLQKNNQLVSLKVPLPDTLRIYGCGIAIKKENSSLTAEDTRSIAELRRTGELARLEKQWNMKGE